MGNVFPSLGAYFDQFVPQRLKDLLPPTPPPTKKEKEKTTSTTSTTEREQTQPAKDKLSAASSGGYISATSPPYAAPSIPLSEKRKLIATDPNKPISAARLDAYNPIMKKIPNQKGTDLDKVERETHKDPNLSNADPYRGGIMIHKVREARKQTQQERIDEENEGQTNEIEEIRQPSLFRQDKNKDTDDDDNHKQQALIRRSSETKTDEDIAKEGEANEEKLEEHTETASTSATSTAALSDSESEHVHLGTAPVDPHFMGQPEQSRVRRIK